MFGKAADLRYYEYLQRKQALTYNFECDIDNLMEDFAKNFEVPEDGDYPHLLKLLTRKKIRKETFIIMQDCVRFFAKWNGKISDTVLWPQIALNCKKLFPFMQYDRDKYCTLLKKREQKNHTSQYNGAY